MRFIRTLFWIIALIALIALSYVCALYFLVTGQSVQKRISDTLAQNYGYQIAMQSQPQVRVIPSIEIALPAARITDQNGSDIANYRSGHLTLNPLWLVAGRIHVESLRLEGASISITRPSDMAQLLQSLQTDRLALFEGMTIESVQLEQSELALLAENDNIFLHNINLSIVGPAPQMHGNTLLSAQIQAPERQLLFEVESSFTLDCNLFQKTIAFENVSLKATGTREASPLVIEAQAPLIRLSELESYFTSAHVNVAASATSDAITLDVADLLIDDQSVSAPDLRINYAMGSAEHRFALDIRSPVTYTRSNQTLNAQHLQGSFTLPHAIETMPLSGQIFFDFSKKMLNTELFSRLQDAPMTFKGKLENFSTPHITGQLTFGRFDLALLDTLPLVLGSDALKTIEQQAEQVQQSLGIAPVASLNFSLLSQAYASEMPATETLGTPMSATANTAETHVPTTETVTPAEVVTPTETVTPAQSATDNAPTPSETVEVQETVQKAPENPAETISEPSEGPSLDNQSDEHQSSFAWLNSFSYDGNLIIGELVFHKNRLSQFKTPLIIRDGVVSMPKISALAYDGQVSGNVTFAASGLWNVRLRANSVSIAPYVTDLGAAQPMPGYMNVQADLYGNGFDALTLNGQIGLLAQQTALRGFDLTSGLRAIEAGKTASGSEQAITAIEKLHAVVHIEEGKAHTQTLKLQTTGFALEGEAQTSFADDLLQGTLQGQSDRGLQVEVALTGKWYDPALTLDSQEIMKANNIVAKQPEKAKAPSKWDQLKNFIRERF